jgi:RNA polymerase sigma-70 factor (ECF subfamily)
VDDATVMARAFENHRGHLRAVAYRMLGSLAEADDAVQETWLRLARSDVDDVRDLRAWLTTVISRVSLDQLRSRAARRDSPMGVRLPDPLIEPIAGGPTGRGDPEASALQADTVGLALLVVLEELNPTERLAFVLHDVFGVPFEQIGVIVGRSTSAAKQLASRARRRVRHASTVPSADPTRQRRVLEAFLAAARDGDFARLVALLDPDVVLRADAGPDDPRSQVVRGATAVAGQALRFAGLAGYAREVLVNGRPGLLAAPGGEPFAVLSVVLTGDRIAEMDILADPARLPDLVPAGVFAPGELPAARRSGLIE